MIEAKLTERQLREREYYEKFSEKSKNAEVCFDPIAGKEKRPWNPYWYVYDKVLKKFTHNSQKLLDFGCGNGATSVVFAKIGYDVYGFDISKNNISIAKNLAKTHELENRTHFSVQVGEKLNYPAESFDMIVGIDILHHLEIKQAMLECYRLLRRGGIAIFREPVEVPALDWMRNNSIGMWLVPKEKSFDRHITEDENKLTMKDIAQIRDIFPNLIVNRFTLFSRVDPFIRKLYDKNASFLEKIDYVLFKSFPILSCLGSSVVLILKKE